MMRVLMVCLGNICRSPLAEGILKKKIDDHQLDWEVDSAGTSDWHAGELPDSRSISVARRRGIDITDQRSRQIRAEDLQAFDHIIAMDSSNYGNIINLAQEEAHKDKVSLLLNYKYPGENRAVPDPYLEGGFDSVFDMIEEAVEAFVQKHKP